MRINPSLVQPKEEVKKAEKVRTPRPLSEVPTGGAELAKYVTCSDEDAGRLKKVELVYDTGDVVVFDVSTDYDEYFKLKNDEDDTRNSFWGLIIIFPKRDMISFETGYKDLGHDAAATAIINLVKKLNIRFVSPEGYTCDRAMKFRMLLELDKNVDKDVTDLMQISMSLSSHPMIKVGPERKK
jgi:hypothetical protein